jgi:hypothetical protein
MKEAMPAGLIGGVSQVHIRVLDESATPIPLLSRNSRGSLLKASLRISGVLLNLPQSFLLSPGSFPLPQRQASQRGGIYAHTDSPDGLSEFVSEFSFQRRGVAPGGMMLSYWYVRVERCTAVSASAGGRSNERYSWVLLLITALLRLLVAVVSPQ